MRPLWKDIVLGIAIGFILPGIVLNYTVGIVNIMTANTDREETRIKTNEMDPEEETIPSTPLIMLFRSEQESVEQYDMDTYLISVLLGEMPSYFEEEALKAQAVVARTYALKAYETGGKHLDGSVCGNSSCCQAYVLQEEYLNRGGTSQDIEKIRKAVEATSGLVLCYEDSLIEATYFSCSGGRTEDAAAVWGTDFPYLRSVESPGEEAAAHYSDTVTFTKTVFAEILGIVPEGKTETWIGEIDHTSGGGIAQITIGGKHFTGIQLRQLLGLRSTDISIVVVNDKIEITTMGFGHRVGMSQYGADAMAAAGSDFQQILTYYYQGAEVVAWNH